MSKMVRVLLIIIAILIGVGATFFVGSTIYFDLAIKPGISGEQSLNCGRNPAPGAFKAEPYYTGPLFDTHLHIPAALPPPKKLREALERNLGQKYAVLGEATTIEKIVCLMDRENISKSVAFFPYIDYPFIGQPFINVVKRSVKEIPDRFVPFLAPVPFASPIPEASTLKKLFDNNRELYQGYGELTFYWDSYQGLSPNDSIFMDSFNMLGERNLKVMIHPDHGQTAALEKAFTNNPDVTFILHGMNSTDPISHLLSEYPNVYYTLDSPGLQPFFESKSEKEFINEMEQSFHQVLNRAVRTWKGVVEANPEKILWGTDRFSAWSYDEKVSPVLEEYQRAFIGRLSPSVQELYAYKNAEQLFGN